MSSLTKFYGSKKFASVTILSWTETIDLLKNRPEITTEEILELKELDPSILDAKIEVEATPSKSKQKQHKKLKKNKKSKESSKKDKHKEKKHKEKSNQSSSDKSNENKTQNLNNANESADNDSGEEILETVGELNDLVETEELFEESNYFVLFNNFKN
jgi:hypothetical protein